MTKSAVPDSVFQEPWNGSLSERLSALAGADFRILYFYEHPDSASFRYRCYNMAQAVNSSGRSSAATYIFLSDLDALGNPSEFADVLVVCRTRYDSVVENLISSFRNAGKKVFFDIDDLIFDVSYTPLVASNLNFDLWGEGLDKWFSLISRMGATMMLCDEVITTNSYLSELAHRFSGLPAHVIPNFLNHEQVEASERLVAAEGKERRDDDRFVLGYFSGSRSHKKDFDVIADSVATVLATHPVAELLVVGHLEIPTRLRDFGHRVRIAEFTDYVTLQSLISSADLCLAPLQDSVFTYAKSQLKFFEAGAVGVPTMATPSPPFHEAINHGKNGYLAPSGQWTELIEGFIAGGKTEKKRVGTAARVSALKNFGPTTHSGDIVKVLGGA
jgi:glycosyltransferase involved in cell wall biosynthesis